MAVVIRRDLMTTMIHLHLAVVVPQAQMPPPLVVSEQAEVPAQPALQDGDSGAVMMMPHPPGEEEGMIALMLHHQDGGIMVGALALLMPLLQGGEELEIGVVVVEVPVLMHHPRGEEVLVVAMPHLQGGEEMRRAVVVEVQTLLLLVARDQPIGALIVMRHHREEKPVVVVVVVMVVEVLMLHPLDVDKRGMLHLVGMPPLLDVRKAALHHHDVVAVVVIAAVEAAAVPPRLQGKRQA